jgi:hypothetical protein
VEHPGPFAGSQLGDPPGERYGLAFDVDDVDIDRIRGHRRHGTRLPTRSFGP